MDDLIFKYPHTDLHSVNLDYILKIVRENAGLHLEISGNQLILKTADNTIISAVTIPYATEAGSANTASSAGYASTAGSASSAGYATTAGTAATATNATNAVNAQNAATSDYATTAGSAASATTATNATNATNAQNAVNAQTAEYAETTGNVEHALNAFEAVAVQGNEMKFTKGDGSSVLFTPSFCSRADKDGLGNVIKATYVSNVVDDNGTLKFQNAQGNTIVSLIPSVTQAQTDSYGNTIADYIKAIEVSGDSNYVTIDHGTGTSDTITIPYSDKAWKDTNGNVIKNTYIKRLEIVNDPNDGHKKLVAYNGDTPEAELFRIPVEGYYAQEAGEASHAAAADYATSAGSSSTATTAGTADTSKDKYYYINCYSNEDGSNSVSSPDTITVEGIYDSLGNAISLDSITEDNFYNVYFRYRSSENLPFYNTYPVNESYKVGSPNSPVFLKSRVITEIGTLNGTDFISYIDLEIGILNGAVSASKAFTYEALLTPNS